MSRIKILPENLANQIAAGEVVERPSSVVKELVENAIDAGAANLSVHIEGGGTSLIRVIDDGIGMDQDDILLSLERHATSKLSSSEDLDRIKSLGFRGEAVPSIASVSRMAITSRLADEALGCRVEVRFGKVMKVHEMGCQRGTVVEVRNLFGNVPARKKFLKTTRTELAHIEDIIRNYGLVRPDLALQYSVNGRETLSLPAGGSGAFESRLKKLLGLSGNAEFLDLSGDSDGAEIAVSGYILPPDRAHPPAARLRAFVNGRPVKDRMISHAVTEGMKNFLMKGRFPAGVIFLDLPAGVVDVNVHPTKQEVRFHNSGRVHKDIVDAISQSLLRYQKGLKESLFGPGRKADHEPAAVAPSPAVKSPVRPVAEAEKKISRDPAPPDCAKMEEAPRLPSLAEPGIPFKTNGTNAGESERDGGTATGPEPQENRDCEATAQIGHLRVIGQLSDSYILCEGKDGLVAIDQHAAQERLIFEKLKTQFGKGKLAGQRLMFPKTLELDGDDIQTIESEGEEIARLGLEITEFGGSTYVLKAVPAVMAHLPPEEVLSTILQQVSGKGEGKGGRDLDGILATIACKAAIKANHRLQQAELESLLKEMQEKDVFSHCPHGRPVVRMFTMNEIKKWFHRT